MNYYEYIGPPGSGKTTKMSKDFINHKNLVIHNQLFSYVNFFRDFFFLYKIYKLKNKNIVRAIPLPPVEINKGPIIICPPNKNAKNFFKHLGTVIEMRNEKLSYKFWSTASIMASYYEILNISSHWLIKKGINKTTANNYISELFLSLSQDAVNKKSQGFKKIVADSQTPKGLNMQVLNELKRGKFYTKFIKAMDNINKRVSS